MIKVEADDAGEHSPSKSPPLEDGEYPKIKSPTGSPPPAPPRWIPPPADVGGASPPPPRWSPPPPTWSPTPNEEEGEFEPEEKFNLNIASVVTKPNQEAVDPDIDSQGRSRRQETKRREEERRRRHRSRSASRSRSPDRRRRRSPNRSDRDRNRSGRDRSRPKRHSREKSPEHVAVKTEPEVPPKDPQAIPKRQQRTVDLLTSKTGGAYIPPARLRLLQAEITDKSSAAYQRIAWEALKKSIHGYINKVNVDNIGIITRELLKENIVRGRGLLCRSIIQAQAASITFTHVYAALVSVINSKFPNIGELLLQRLVIQFKRGFRRNDKTVCLSASRFVAHLVNQRVAHEILALEILTLLVETPTDDSVEVAIAFLKESGMKLQEVSSKGVNAIFEMLKNILHEGRLDKRVQYMIEVVFQVRKDGFKDHLAVQESLELVEEDDQFTHLIMLDDATDTQDVLNVFKFDPEYQDNEQKYKGLSKELLGSDGSSSESGSGSGSGSDSSDDEDEAVEAAKQDMIIDQTETNLVALRRTIYLTIHSSLDYEECAHKLMKMELKPGQEMELCHMFLDCCAEQRTYEKFYGLLAQRFCNINKIYIPPFEEIFKDTYSTTHRLDTNRLRNVSKFFAHLLFTDAIGWDVFECIRLNEDDTTSSSRIFIKILFQELAEYMGLGKLNARLKDAMIQESFAGLFPRDNPRNTRFAVNFFTSIGLGGLTDELREHLKNVPKLMTPIVAAEDVNTVSSSSSSSDSSSSSSDSSDSSSSSDSDASSDSDSSDDGKKKKKNKSNSKAKVKVDEKKGKNPFGKHSEKESRKGDSKLRKQIDNSLERYAKPGKKETKKIHNEHEDKSAKSSQRNSDRRGNDPPQFKVRAARKRHTDEDSSRTNNSRRSRSVEKDSNRGKTTQRRSSVSNDRELTRSRNQTRRSRSVDGVSKSKKRKHASPEPDTARSRNKPTTKDGKAEPDVSYWGRKVDYESDVESKQRRRKPEKGRKSHRSISSDRG